MQYDIRYTSFNGAAGTARMDSLEDLPLWLWEWPGTHILDISLVGASIAAQKLEKECREEAVARFAENLLASLQNYRGE